MTYPDPDPLVAAGVEVVDEDPAPDLQYKPDSADVIFLKAKLGERWASGRLGHDLVGAEDLSAPQIYLLGYETAIHDLHEFKSAPGLSVQVVVANIDGIEGNSSDTIKKIHGTEE